MKRIKRIVVILSMLFLTGNVLGFTGCVRSYNIGDKGPGGGLIIYVNRAGFTVDGYGTAYYLEAAPVDLGVFAWASDNHSDTNIEGTKEDLGSGRKNTDLILAVDANAPAAKACADYRGGGKRDWFLPSWEELNLVYQQRGLFVISSGSFWSSSQLNDYFARSQLFNDGNRDINGKDYIDSVRAIRAF